MARRPKTGKPTEVDTPERTSYYLDNISEVAYRYLSETEDTPDLSEAARVGLILTAAASGCQDSLLYLCLQQSKLIKEIACSIEHARLFGLDGTKVDLTPIHQAMAKRRGPNKKRSLDQWALLAGIDYDADLVYAWYQWYFCDQNEQVQGLPETWPTTFWLE